MTRRPTTRTISLAVLASLALLQACSTTPTPNARLEEARSAYASAMANPQLHEGAVVEMKQAGEALARADAAWTRGDEMASVEHLAYLARQRVALAEQVGQRKLSEADVASAGAERDQLRLAARTREADAAQSSAQAAQRDARASQQQAQSAERDARASQRQAEASQLQSEAARREAAAAQQQAQASAQRTLALEQQLRDMDARKTERGMVVTIGDVLFDSGRAELKPGAERNMDKLVTFLQEYPQRQALVEGFTDSVGSEAMNRDLSVRRADAVRSALASRGIDRSRIDTQGYGESFPVAGNDSAGGRQMNRRVEIVLSEDGGRVAPR